MSALDLLLIFYFFAVSHCSVDVSASISLDLQPKMQTANWISRRLLTWLDICVKALGLRILFPPPPPPQKKELPILLFLIGLFQLIRMHPHCLLTSPPHGRGYSAHCVCVCACVCESVTALAGASRALQPQVRYQPKALYARNKKNGGFSLSTLSSKVMTDFSALTTVRLVLTPQIQYLQGAGAVKTRLVGQALRLVLAQIPSIVSIVLATSVSL